MPELDLARVKRNIGKMIDQGAPEADIDAYVSSEGTTPDALRAHSNAPAAPSAPTVSVPSFDAMGNSTGGTEDVVAPAPMPYADQIGSAVGALGRGADNVVRSVADNVSLGTADKLAARMNSLAPGSPSYGDALATERARTEALPAGVKAVGMAGGMALPLGMAKAGASLVPLMEGAPLLSRVGMLGVEGAGYGAANKVGHTDSDSVADYGRAAVDGASEGAALGGGLGLVGSAAGGAYRLGTNVLAPKVGDMSRGATRALSTLFDRSAGAADAATANGDAGMLLDSGPLFKGMAQGAGSNPMNEGAGLMKTRLDERDALRSSRLAEDLDQHIGGTGESLDATRQGIADTSRSVQAPLLAAADATPAPRGPAMDALAARASVAPALREAADIASDQGQPLRQVVLDESGNVVPNDAAEQFASGSRGRMDDAVGQLFGARNVMAKADTIKAERARAGDNYRDARSATIDWDSPEGKDLAQVFPLIPDSAKRDGALIHSMSLDRLNDAPAAAAPSAATLPRTVEKVPESISQFVSRNGGIKADSDATALGLHELKAPGGGRLARPNGLPIDEMQTRLEEQGFLPRFSMDELSEDRSNDIRDMLRRDATGDRVYPETYHGPGRVNPDDARQSLEMQREAQGRVLSAAVREGVDPTKIDPSALDRAAARIHGEPDVHPYAAYRDAQDELATERANGGAAKPVERPDPEMLHYWRRGLDKLIEDNTTLGSVNQLGHEASTLRRALDDRMKAAIPGLAEGDEIWADGSRRLAALDKGREWLRSGVTPEQVRREFSVLPEHEQDLARQGYGAALREKLGNTGDRSTMPHVVAGSENVRAKTAILAPSREHLARFNNALMGEQRQFSEATLPDMRAWRNAHEVVADKAAKLGDTTKGRSVGTAATDVERALSDASPEFAEALRRGRQYTGIREALDNGESVVTKAPDPRDFRPAFEALDPSRQIATRMGARGALDRTVGTSTNDLAALKRTFGDGLDYNRQNLSTLFGDDAVKGVVSGVDREAAFARNRNDIAGGSQTEPRRQAKEAFDNSFLSEIPKNATPTGLAAHYGQKAVGALVRKFTESRSDALRSEVADLLSRQGADRDKVVADIMAGVRARQDRAGTIRDAASSLGARQGLLSIDNERRPGGLLGGRRAMR